MKWYIGLLYYTIKQRAMWKKAQELLLDIILPKTCFGCAREGDFLCPDCQCCLNINSSHKAQPIGHLNDLYWSMPYENNLFNNIIKKCKYEPFVKELSKNISSIILEHLYLIEKATKFTDFNIVPIPLEINRLKWRGFNQSEEIAKNISEILNIRLLSDCLIKTKKTLPQTELEEQERITSQKDAFAVSTNEDVRNKKILLVDDFYITGATMQECARLLKYAGAKEVMGIVAARG